MEITIKHFDGERPQFNVILHTAKGAEPFLEIKGCRIVNGTNGPFVSWPATKNQTTGKYWSHVYGGEKFNEHVLRMATGGAPSRPHPPRPAPPPRSPARTGSGFDDMDNDIPF